MDKLTLNKLIISSVLGFGAGLAFAQSSADFAAQPPLISESAAPNVMLVMSNDHELSKKAYSDYTDLDNDGSLDVTYNDSFSYTGYFDANFCYAYNSGRFEPVTDISASIAGSGHDCSAYTSSPWSGNFMNWATMTRMDIVRYVLYGGLRVVDTATSGATDGVTVLERAFLPEDIHSFVKVFAGDTEKYTPYTQSSISLCNTTSGGASNAPLVRIAYGSWPQWSSSEVVQCHYEDERNSGLDDQPESSDRPSPYDFNVRVLACDAGVDSGNSRCKAYVAGGGDITYKPVGLLQEYGDNGGMNFGLMTGSYNEKISGGVLRKDILPLIGNTDSNDDEIDLDNGTFINQDPTDAGIINTLNRLRIVNWNYTNNNYSDCDTYSISISTFKTSTSSNRQCRNWGNPLSEIYLEALRYFSGANGASGAVPTASFNTSDATQISSLPQLSWSDPITSDNACASCSIIVISTGLNSFDRDELGTVSDVWEDSGSSRLSGADLDSLVDLIGDLEAITNGSYLVGNNGYTNDDVCTAKTVYALSDVEGLCPEIPSLEGGFSIAGLAFHAQGEDLRDDFEGIQSVNTYSVALAESLPSFELDVNGNTVTFVPTCQAHTDSTRKIDQSGWTDCSLVDVTIESYTATSGRILVAWEDSQWGNDYDMDGISRIEWCIGADTASCPGQPPSLDLGSGYNWSDFEWETSGIDDDSVQFRVSAPQAAAGNALRFGYVISGVENQISNTDLITNTDQAARNSTPTTSGGKYIVRERLENGEQPLLLRRGGFTIRRLNANSGNRIIYVEPAVYTASASVTAGKLLENPLWYTAKYGSFNDIDGDGTPRFNGSSSDTREWDVRDTQGNEGADGIPDNFYPVRDPSQLITNLGQIFADLSERISSGTASAIESNSSSGLGAIYQAYYYPQYTDDEGNTVTWSGVMHSIFVDASGRFREDNGIKGRLEDTSIDYVVRIFFDQSVTPNRTRFQRFTQGIDLLSGESVLQPVGDGSAVDLEELGSIWNARNELADISQTDLAVQRTVSGGEFTENAGSKRYIFTWLDSLASGTQDTVDSGEVVDFTASTFDPSLFSNNYRYLGISDSSMAEDLVDYVRGIDQPARGWRSRQVDLPGDGSSSVKYWLLGDVAHSSPVVVNPPDSRYDIQYGDNSYDVFQQQYDRRRQMVYVGGNDGMIHAFNGGVWDSAVQAFYPQQLDPDTGTYTLGQSHELGAEMWGYVPMNLLPHLQWLKEANYPHVYYVDGSMQTFDVNIFTPDATHPNGWGTILVATMRLGGGDFSVDLDGDASDDMTMRSAIVILDVTDPEGPPTLIAEVTAPNLAYTTSAPALVKARVPDASGSYASPSLNEWILVYGSGPTDLDTVTSSQDPVFFAYDLVDRQEVTIASTAQVPASNPSGFFGDFLVVDLNEDFVDDVIYAGTVEGTEVAPEGRLLRIDLDPTTSSMGLSSSGGMASLSTLIDINKPVSARANTIRDVGKNEHWVQFGTGRLFTSVDNRSTVEQFFIGVKDPATGSSISANNLVDTTDLIVKTDGTVYDSDTGEGFAAALVYADGVSVGESISTFTELYSVMDGEGGWLHALSSGGGNPAERVFTTSLALESTILFTSYLPSYDLCTVEGDSFLYAYNFRTGTAESFSPFGDEDGVVYAGIELGQGAASAPAVIISTGNETTVTAEEISSGETQITSTGVTVMTTTSTGTPEQEGFSPRPGTSGRMSWEILDIPF